MSELFGNNLNLEDEPFEALANELLLEKNILKFGKYKGETIEVVYDLDPGYCQWLAKINSKNLTEDIKIFLKNKFNDDSSFIMRWGKYKNKSLKYINEHDRNYIHWLKNSDKVKPYKDVLKGIDDLSVP